MACVPHFLTGHAPVTTAADAFCSAPGGDVTKVMPARIGSDAGIAALREGPANPHARRRVRIHSPSVDPDDGNRLG